jgi:hypothetical protein
MHVAFRHAPQWPCEGSGIACQRKIMRAFEVQWVPST